MEASLKRDSYQTQEQLALPLEVTQRTDSLQIVGNVQQEVTSIPYKLQPREEEVNGTSKLSFHITAKAMLMEKKTHFVPTIHISSYFEREVSLQTNNINKSGNICNI